MADKQINERDTKLIQWLNEAYAKEAELEMDLAAHIALTKKASYKKRLRQHLKETREHKRSVAKQIKALGGTASAGPDVPLVSGAIGDAAGKAVATVKGQVGVARAMVTEQAETHVRNVAEELREEQVEIAIYTRIETFATEVGDRGTASLTRRIRREEERMAKYLSAELPRLVKEVVKAEIPREQRTKATGAKRKPVTKSGAGTRSGSARKSGTARRTTTGR